MYKHLKKCPQKYNTEFREIFSQVRPGIVDFATVLLRDEEALLRGAENPREYYENHVLPQKIRLIKQYIHRQSIGLDFCLMSLLFLVVISPKFAQFIVHRLIGKTTI